MFTFIGYDLLVHYIYIISVLRQRRRSFLLDWGGGGGNLKDAKKKKKKKKIGALCTQIRNCKLFAHGALVKFDGLVVQDGAFELFLHCMMPPPPPPPQDRRLCLKTLNKSSSNLYVSELL